MNFLFIFSKIAQVINKRREKSKRKIMFGTPKISDVIHALERQKKERELGWKDTVALRYHKDNEDNKEYIRKFNDAKEILAARQNQSRQYQPLMPRGSSNRHRSRSPNNRRGHGHQQQSLPDVPSDRRRYRSPNAQLRDRQQSLPVNPRNHYLSRSPSRRYDHEESHSIPKDWHYNTSQFYNRKQRSPTPISDNHIVDDDDDGNWNPNPQTPENNNAIGTPTSSVQNSDSQSEQTSVVTPFIMGTLRNVDNSCYMNSILYILRMTPMFVHNIHHLLQNIQCILEEYDDTVEMAVTANDCFQLIATSVMVSNREQWPGRVDICARQVELINQLHKIFARMTALEVYESTNSIEKSKLQDAVREIDPIFTPRTQQDSHEFLLTILNCIRDCGASLMKLVQEHASMFDK